MGRLSIGIIDTSFMWVLNHSIADFQHTRESEATVGN